MASQRGQDHGWFIDPLTHRRGKGTRESPGHPRQCRAPNKFKEQCSRWALKGRNYCQFHGGRQPLTRFKVSQRYGKYATKAVRQLIEEMAAAPTEVLDLTEELNIGRMMLAQSLKLASPCFEPGNTVSDETKVLAISTLKESLNQVQQMASACAKIESMTRDKIPVSHMNYFMSKVLEIINEHVNDKQAEKIGRALAAIKLPHSADIDTRVKLELD